MVYKAQDLKLDRIIALKFIPRHISAAEAERERFLQEAKAAAGLNHPNICTIHGIEEAEGEQFIVMELVDGFTLREKIQNGMLPVNVATDYAIQIGEALQEAHSKGVVHRDIKPENIMVNSKNRIKVMDFGLAKLKGSLKLTRTSSTVGTLAYMSPEQILGMEVDPRTDIFALGIVLYEMLTGKLPFRGEHDAAMTYSIVNEEPEPLQKHLPQANSELLHVIDRSLEKNPDERYLHIQDIVVDLRRLKKGTSRVSRAHSATPSDMTNPSITVRTSRNLLQMRRFLFIGALLFLFVAGITSYALFFSSSREINPAPTFRAIATSSNTRSYANISSDGNWIAFAASDKNNRWDLYLMNSSGESARRITLDSSEYIDSPSFSPDGANLVYARGTFRNLDLCVVPSLGGVSRVIGHNAMAAKWRPDGKRIGFILFNFYSAYKKNEFHTVAPDGSDHRTEFIDTLGGHGYTNFSWSPDGESIAWIRGYSPLKGEIVIRHLPTGNERTLTNYGKYTDDVCWTNQGYLIFTSNLGGSVNLWALPEAGGKPIQITKGNGPDFGSSISFDGRRLLYTQTQFSGYLRLSKLDGSQHRQLTVGHQLISGPAISPDRQTIAFTTSDPYLQDSDTKISLVDRNGDPKNIQLPIGEVQLAPSWSPNGKYIAYRTRRFDQPAESSQVQVVDASTGSHIRTLGEATAYFWLNDESLVLFRSPKSFLCDLNGNERPFHCLDSTFSVPILNGTYLLFNDGRERKAGWWISPITHQETKAKRVPLKTRFNLGLIEDGRFIFTAQAEQLIRISLPDFNVYRFAHSFPGLSSESIGQVSKDGKELVYVENRHNAKMILIEDLFK